VALAIVALGVTLPSPSGIAADRVPLPRQSTLALEPCPDAPRARCGTLPRPLDPSDPAAGTIGIGFRVYPPGDPTQPPLEAIVAQEGGPGYSTSGSADSYTDLFAPLMDRHPLLLVDARGTGTSEPIECPPLQSYAGNYTVNVGLCGIQLGPAADMYGTAFAADDMAAVIQALGFDRVDYYGDSYGTFFGQTFAVRHPDLLRSLVLDAAYPVEGGDPWYRDANAEIRHAFELTCQRNPSCVAPGGSPIDRMKQLLAVIRTNPIDGVAPDADGIPHRIHLDASLLASVAYGAATAPTVYRELDAAMRAALRPEPDTRPLLRLAAESIIWGGGGNPADFSEGLYDAVSCNDYIQAYDMLAPPSMRRAQYRQALGYVERSDPDGFAPFTLREWASQAWSTFDDCLLWPVPSRYVPPLPPGHVYPDVPTLVLVGDLDSLTSPQGARQVAGRFPNSTFVVVSNMTHVSALGDYGRCASDIVVRFVETLSGGDTSCVKRYDEVHMVPEFAVHAADLPGGVDVRTAAVATGTVGDVLARWWGMAGYRGVGLRGGTFVTAGITPHVRWTLHGVRWVEDVAVDGSIGWNRSTGAIEADVRLDGPGAPPSSLHLAWNDWEPHARAHVSGTVGGDPVDLFIPAP
jgi:pimeloyl-ACP methyl ester carboxylesterase